MDSGQARGYIHFDKGNVVHSEVQDAKGEEAFFQILQWKSGNFNFVHDIKPTQLTMDDEVQYLLMEVAHRQDQQQRDKA